MSHTTTLIKVPLTLLEAIDREGAKAHSAGIQQCERMRVDQGWEADVTAHPYLFSNVLETEGLIKDTDHGVEMGYVTPATVKTRAEELEKVDIEALYRQGLFQEFPNFDTLGYLKSNLGSMLKFHREAAQGGLGLIIMGVY
jgi:hypothetical protein